MTEVGLAPSYGQRPESAGLTARLPLTLAEEHVLLLWQVTARADEAADRGRAGPVARCRTGGAGGLRPGRGAAPGV